MEVTKQLDCKGLCCPEPVINLKLAINELSSGDVIELHATDPGSVADMKAWSHRTGNPLIDSKQEGDVYIYFIQKK